MHYCNKCGLPQFDGPMGYVGPQCRCFNYRIWHDPLTTPVQPKDTGWFMDPLTAAKPSSGPLYTQAELDLAVIKERERIINLLTQYIKTLDIMQ